MRKAIQEAIDKAGSQAALGDQIKTSKQFVGKAVQQGWLPLEKAKIVHDLYGIPLVDLVRDDIADAMRLAAR